MLIVKNNFIYISIDQFFNCSNLAFEFVKRNNHTCAHDRRTDAEFDSLEKAKSACRVEEACRGILDCRKHIPLKKMYFKCVENPIHFTHEPSFVYEKRGKLPFLPFHNTSRLH